MISWWAGLSWSHAMLVVLCVAVAVGALICMLAPRPGAPSTRRDGSSPWPIVDYSREYRKKAEQLGDRFILAKPINRRSA